MPRFLHPGLAASAVALVCLPILIHLLSRRRYERRPWAAMRFLQRAHRRTRQRRRLERWLLLSLRVGMMALIALGVARPTADAAALGRLLADARADHLLLVDTSGSMRAATRPGATALHAARDTAVKLLAEFGASDGVAVVAAAPAAALTEQPVHDPGAIRRVLDGLRCDFRPGDLRQAFERAAAVLERSRSPAPQRRVYVLTDLATRDWLGGSAADRAARRVAALRLAALANVSVINVGPLARDNAAIESLAIRDRLVGSDMPVTIRATVRNFGAAPLRDLPVEVRIDGARVRNVTLAQVVPGAAESVDVAARLERGGAHVVSAHLALHDALESDNERSVAVEAAEGLNVVLVEGPRSAGVGQSYYVGRALAATRTEQRPGLFNVSTIGDLDLSTTSLEEARVVVLCDAAGLGAAQWARLQRFVDNGGGLLIATGESAVDAPLVDAAAPLLPASLGVRSVVGAQAPAVTLRIDDPSHPVLADFAGGATGGLLAARFERYCTCEPLPGARSVLWLTSGTAVLIERGMGRGRVALWTSSLDLSGNTLPAKPDFVPLMLNLVGYLAGEGLTARNVAYGEPVELSLAGGSAESPAALSLPDGRTVELPVTRHARTAVVRFATGPAEAAGTPGAYRVTSGAARSVACVQAPADEGELAPVGTDAVRDLFGGAAQVYPSAAAWWEARRASPQSDWSSVALGLLFVVVLVETMVAAHFGHRG